MVRRHLALVFLLFTVGIAASGCGGLGGTASCFFARRPLREANDLVLKGEYRKAVDSYNQAAYLAPECVWIYEQRGRLYLRLREFDRAIADYTKVISLLPNSPLGYVRRSRARIAVGQFDGAATDAKQVIAMAPQFYDGYAALGDVLEAQNDYRGASTQYRKVVQLAPRWYGGYASLGFAESEFGDYKDALANYDAATRIDPDATPGGVYFNRMLLYLEMWKLDPNPDMESDIDRGRYRDTSMQYTMIVGSLGLRIGGKTKEAAAKLSYCARFCNQSEWPMPIIRYLRGELSQGAVLAQATNNNKMTEAQAYIAVNDLLAGRIQDARPRFQWVLAHGNRRYIEYGIARALIKKTKPD